ncbi:hypothetical protein [Actinoplanes sp. URMC 104]|uniref:hypothetical protein n=1 Tax=Actinoplanes sp. URMC 104 TaxID=3423409 RepID=UPI003F1BBD33
MRETAVSAAEFVVALARDVSARLAPDESGVFDQVAQAWLTGPHGWVPGGVGLGFDDAMLSSVILEVISAAVGGALGIGAEVVRARMKKRRRAGENARELVEATLPAVDGRIVVTEAQAERLREAAREHGAALGLDEQSADLLADALVGAVHVPEDEDEDEDPRPGGGDAR